MKSILMTTALLLCSWMTFAQINSGPESSAEFSAPAITPVSPEAGTMTQYGNVPVNMSAGQMSFQVPIHTIPIRGGYSWPVNLNYRYAGLMLEAKPSIAGLGWVLSGGGVVSREVRGIPDGNPYGIYGAQNGDLITPIVNNNDITLAEAETVIGGRADTELDKYNVSVGGVSFSFKVDVNNQPIYLSEHNYKVEFPNRTPTWLSNVRTGSVPVRFYGEEIRSFTVTDDKGIKYFFNDIEINEPQGFELEPVYTEAGLHGYFSSWQLSSIQYPNGQTITFSYELNTLQNYDYSGSGYKNINPPFVTQPGSCSNLQNNINSYNQSSQLTQIRRLLLSEIDFPTGSIDLNIANQNTWKLYNQIQVKNSSNQVIFDYDLSHSGNRDVLTEVLKDGNYYYEFDYHSGVPNFLLGNNDFPYKQDYWGFYNGRNNLYLLNIPDSQISADKRASFHNTRAGAMTRIKYPTGGYSQIQYEQNQVKKLYSEVEEENYTPNRQILVKLETDNVSGAPATKSVSFEYTFDYPVIALVSHKAEAYDQWSDISVKILTDCTPTPSMFHYYDVAPYLRSPENPIPDFCVNLIQDINPDQTNYPIIHSENSSGYIRINPGTYTFSIDALRNDYSRSEGEILVQFYDPPETGSGDPYVNAGVGGIRVHTITHVNNKGANTQQKFDYNDDDGLSTGMELMKGQNEYPVQVLYDCYNETTGHPMFDNNVRYLFNRTNYVSRYYNPVNLNSGVPVFYKRVKQFPVKELIEIDLGAGGLQIYPHPDDQNPDGSRIFTVLGGTGISSNVEIEERFTKGYTITEFEDPDINSAQAYFPFTPRGEDLQMGRTKSTEVYAFWKDSLSYILKQKQENTYLDRDVNVVTENHPYSVKFGTKRVFTRDWRSPGLNFDYSGGVQPPDITGSDNADYYHMFVYRDHNIDFVPAQSTNRSVIDQTNEVTTTTQNNYDSYFQLKETTVIDSEGKEIKQRFYYPYDISETQYLAMVSRNQISKVIQKEVYEENVLNSTIKTNFTSVGTGDYKPSELLGAKQNNTLEPRLHYSYDGFGNIREHYTAEQVVGQIGPFNQIEPVNVSSFLWAYDHRFPVLKAENLSYADLAIINVGSIQTMDGQTLRNALDLVRQAYPEALVTTYTYDPEAGVTSITDPKGYTVFYEYDVQHRIEFIKDADGNIIKEFNYNLVTD